MSTRLLLVDDHEIFAEALAALLDSEPDLEVIEHLRDGREAVREALESRPDVVLMDISMPGMNGIETMHELRERLPEVKVLFLSMHTERQFVRAALEAGAQGYLVKDCDLSEVIRAIHVVAAGQVYLTPAIASTVVCALLAPRSEVEDSAYTLLTTRERVVLQLLSEGHPTRAIAARLHLSIKTIGSHREHVMSKLGIHSIAGLTKYAIREGLTSGLD